MQYATKNLFLLVLLIGALSFSSCTSDLCEETLTYYKYDAVFFTPAQLRDIKTEGPKTLENPGKIYVYNNYLFINELHKGVHIYDNSDLKNPIPIAFLTIPGNVDIAIRDNYLYADNFIDLLTFDISNPNTPVFLNNEMNVFTNDKYLNPDKGYIVYYNRTQETLILDCRDDSWGVDFILEDGNRVLFASNGNKSNYGSNEVSTNGTGGSMARFTLVNDRLYTIDNMDLNVFSVTQSENPNLINTITVGWGIETIFPYKNKLFIGSTSGLFIFDNSNPDQPQYLSEFRHRRACDPVFVQGNTAYVTLRSGTSCEGFNNQLDVIDISNIESPELIKSYNMSNPHGLTILGDKMIICEGTYGLKVLDIANQNQITTKSRINNKHFFDAIGLSESHIILTGNNGVYQYELIEDELSQLSQISVK